MTEAEFRALYGAWEPTTPARAAELLDGLDWWVVGGWALELATGVGREHDDLDVAVPRGQEQRLAHLLPDHHVWVPQRGSLTPLSGFAVLPADHEQLWVRRDGDSRWLLDVQLQPVLDGLWVFKRDPRIRVPMKDAVRRAGQIPYLAPELVLLHKAHLCRPKDDADLAATLPHLDARALDWLAGTLAVSVPDSPWNDPGLPLHGEEAQIRAWCAARDSNPGPAD